VLYRPVGPRELELVRDSGWTRFPPRLPEQPIFYPVENEQYARQVAGEAFNDHIVGLIEVIASYGAENVP
jgi:hypothetical protein